MGEKQDVRANGGEGKTEKKNAVSFSFTAIRCVHKDHSNLRSVHLSSIEIRRYANQFYYFFIIWLCYFTAFFIDHDVIRKDTEEREEMPPHAY